MIGKIITGKSFRGCLLYCLHDKKEKHAMKERTEVIGYNKCFGNSKDLIRQFTEVRKLNPKLAKPVMHITLSLAPGEKLSNSQLSSIAEKCAEQFACENRQYVAVLHKDTNHQHMHIVANRIDLDGKTLSDSNNYKKMSDFCRKMETEFGLKQVLSPRKFQEKPARQIPRLDTRKKQLKTDIINCLSRSNSYREFEDRMKALGYTVIKGRGIAFLDMKKVYTKGSEVGYSLAKIEKIVGPAQIKREIFLPGTKRKLSPDILVNPNRTSILLNDRTASGIDFTLSHTFSLLNEVSKPALSRSEIGQFYKSRKRKKRRRQSF